MKRFLPPRGKLVCLRAGLVLLVLLSAAIAWAQNTEPGASVPGEPQQQSAQEQRKKPTSIEGELGKETREAAGEEKDESEQFKRSSAVTLVARITGLSLEHAYWLCLLINFAIIAAVLVWVFRSKLSGVFASRTRAIQKAIEEAHQASAEANRRLAEIETRLGHLDAELKQMRAGAEKEAAAEEARISAEADEDARKIASSIEQEIVAATKAVQRELKAYVADLATALASRSIRVSSSVDQALVQSFAEQLSSEKNGSGKDGH